MPAHKQPRCGLAVLAGAPNVGKSTLLNRVLGTKLAIVSPKPQTTRNRIAGILQRPDAQAILIDTPGIHRSRRRLNRLLTATAEAALADADVAVLLTDFSPRGPTLVEGDLIGLQELVPHLARLRVPVLLAINKVDRLPQKDWLLPVMARAAELLPQAELHPISALTGDGVPALVDAIVARLPRQPRLFEPDALTDLSERFLVSEIVREQIFLRTEQEVPYHTAVVVEHFIDERDRQGAPPFCTIHATIYAERPSQKAILIGKRGAMVKAIGSGARPAIEELLGCRVHLELQVGVEPGWTESERLLSQLGLGPAAAGLG